MKRVAETSLAALAELIRTRATREAQVLDGLRRYRRAKGVEPTAYELLRFLQAQTAVFDLNSVRPRLTALRDVGLVETTGKRICAITGKRVFTWAVVTPSPQPVPYVEQRREPVPSQEALF